MSRRRSKPALPATSLTLMFAAWVLPKPSLSATHMSQTGAGDRRDMKA